jgi:hypothetical protein
MRELPDHHPQYPHPTSRVTTVRLAILGCGAMSAIALSTLVWALIIYLTFFE